MYVHSILGTPTHTPLLWDQFKEQERLIVGLTAEQCSEMNEDGLSVFVCRNCLMFVFNALFQIVCITFAGETWVQQW